MAFYRKRTFLIEAFQFTGTFSGDDIPQWFTDAVHKNEVILRGDYKTDSCDIPTLEGVMTAQKGDFIVRGIKGELYPVKPDIFTLTYQMKDGL